MAKQCRILIVENEEQIGTILEEVISIEGYEVEVVRSGPEAIDRMNFTDFDVMIADVVLPGGIDGFSLADRAAAAGVGVIIISGDPHQLERLRQCGHAYLQKPFRMAALILRIEQVLKNEGSACEPRKEANH